MCIRDSLGLAQLYRSYSLYRKAYDQLQTAHEVAPVSYTHLDVYKRQSRGRDMSVLYRTHDCADMIHAYPSSPIDRIHVASSIPEFVEELSSARHD